MNDKKEINSILQEGDICENKVENVVVERPLQIIVNNKEFSMTMQTPGNERYLVRGLLHAEGIQHSEFAEYSQEESENGTTVSVKVICRKEIRSDRALMSSSSCGLCGKKNLDNLFDGIRPIETELSISSEQIQNLYSQIAYKQNLFQKTGGCHSASAADEKGNILCTFEDIGRHNAVDKVIGWLLEHEKLHEAKALLVSGRISYEIIQKCAKAQIPVLTAISAPSSLSVEMAEKWGITIAAFCRADRATFYSHTNRIKQSKNSVPNDKVLK
ncbi:MAG: formate dehydrogenase accessory sulfurtransferase FdhD [Lentisphaeraceae bacterium]|nr:formate dehydrogenase accessory sulfurtransferase FdhD [Lentisphaeraceae bacterium]